MRRRRTVYLRPDAIDRLLAPIGIPDLTRKQQAEFLAIPYNILWRATNAGGRVTDYGIAEILDAAKRAAGRLGSDPMRFEDLFEIRPAAAA